MVNITIDNINIDVKDNTTILEAAKIAGIDIPTLCYLKEINEIASCRICVVEIEGCDKLSTACNTIATDKMVIHTDTKRVTDARKRNIQLILSQHNDSCPTCVRSGNCKLQNLSNELNITDVPFPKDFREDKWDKNSVLIRDDSKCIKCMRCVNVCEKVQSLGVWQLTGTGAYTNVGIADGLTLNMANCALCGQCVINCPVGALKARDDTDAVLDAIYDPEITTVVQIAPSVRTAWGEGLGLPMEKTDEKKLVGVLKYCGFDYVFDTNFSADMTIMEEAHELAHHLKENSDHPMFTSCCPGWVRFMKTQYPDYAKHLSTTKSPQQIFGALTKTYFAKKINKDPKKIFCISIMPCMAKKYECDASLPDTDVDTVITTRELNRLIKLKRINVEKTQPSDFDSPLGTSTGAGVIFGVTGGVMEAALRSAHYFITKKEAPVDAFSFIRGYEPIRRKEVQIGDRTVRIAIVNGLGNAKILLDAIISKKESYDFVEIMACPTGCSGGGGQPIKDGESCGQKRGNELFRLDKSEYKLRKSHENPVVQAIYNEFLTEPLSPVAMELIHTNQENWEL